MYFYLILIPYQSPYRKLSLNLVKQLLLKTSFYNLPGEESDETSHGGVAIEGSEEEAG